MSSEETNKRNEAMIAKMKKIEKLIAEVKKLGGNIYCYDLEELVLELPETQERNRAERIDENERVFGNGDNYRSHFSPDLLFDYRIPLNS